MNVFEITLIDFSYVLWNKSDNSPYFYTLLTLDSCDISLTYERLMGLCSVVFALGNSKNYIWTPDGLVV